MSNTLNENSRMECFVNGLRKPAFVCQHLASGNNSGFFESEDNEDDFQNAWCSQCEEIAVSEGGWTEKSETFAQVTAICEGCFEEIKSRALTNKWKVQQKDICLKYEAQLQLCNLSLKVGISQAVLDGERPINGVRVKEENGTSGWYFWAGEWSDNPDFFLPLHGAHLSKYAEIVLPYLALPEGWRFLIEEGYEDVWFDSEFGV